MQPIVWSHTNWKLFDQCPRQYNLVKNLKLYPPKEGEALIFGREVHKAFELYLKRGEPMPAPYDKFLPWAEGVKEIEGEMLVESYLGFTKEGKACRFKADNVWWRGVVDAAVINREKGVAWIVDWKGLALDTKLPTPTGWTTMGEVKEGDHLYDSLGKVCKVIGKSEVKNIKCFRVTLSDGTEVVCDENHLWKTHDGRIVNVQHLVHSGVRKHHQPVDRIPTALPIQCDEVELPIHPYVLGLWIADGSLASGVVTKPDAFVWEKIQALGYEVNMSVGVYKGKTPTRTVKGLRKHLIALGLLGTAKRIPKLYLRASVAQRTALLQGLMDGDGNANPARKQAVYTTTSEDLASDVVELLASLGQTPHRATVSGRGFNKHVVSYPVSFRPVALEPFSLPRKAGKIESSWGAGIRPRYVTAVVEVPSVPTQCISVDSEDHTFLCTEKMVPTHNTNKNAKYADKDQLELLAMGIMSQYPEIQKVKGLLAFVVSNEPVKETYYRRNFGLMMSKWHGRIDEIEQATAHDVWNPKAGPLCPWCPVTNDRCEYKE